MTQHIPDEPTGREGWERHTVTVDLDALRRRFERQQMITFDDAEILFELIRGEHQRAEQLAETNALVRQTNDDLGAQVGRLSDALHTMRERAERAEAGAAALRSALKQAMTRLPGGTPDDLDPAEYTIVAACDAALKRGAGAALLLAEVKAARAFIAYFRDEHRGCLVNDDELDRLMEACEQAQKGATDG